MSQRDEVLADRLHVEPAIFKGCSSSELCLIVGVAALDWLPVSLLLAGLMEAITMGFGIAGVGVVGTVIVMASLFQRLKRGRPDGYYQQLGIGGLLCDDWTVVQMTFECDFSQSELLESLLNASLAGLQSFVRTDALRLPATYRLPFREFGLSIGLGAVQRLQGSMQEQPELYKNHAYLHGPVGMLMSYQPLVNEIEAFWLDPVNQEAETWKEHLDINSVMLASSLAPDGFLTI